MKRLIAMMCMMLALVTGMKTAEALEFGQCFQVVECPTYSDKGGYSFTLQAREDGEVHLSIGSYPEDHGVVGVSVYWGDRYKTDVYNIPNFNDPLPTIFSHQYSATRGRVMVRVKITRMNMGDLHFTPQLNPELLINWDQMETEYVVQSTGSI